MEFILSLNLKLINWLWIFTSIIQIAKYAIELQVFDLSGRIQIEVLLLLFDRVVAQHGVK